MPRAGLTVARVVEEAADVADEVGLSNLTMAAVAARLGVQVPSLYKHLDGMSELQRRVAIRAQSELAAVLAHAAVGKAGAPALTAMCTACRSWAKKHPGRYAATVHAPEPTDAEHLAASDAIVRVVLDVLDAYQLSGDDAIDAVRALRAALHGFITLEQAGGFGLPVDVDRSFDRLAAGLAEILARWRVQASGNHY